LIADQDSGRPADVAKRDAMNDSVDVKRSTCGGIREALRMIKDARSRGMRVMLGCMTEASLGVSAAGHIASLADYADFDGHLLLAEPQRCIVQCWGSEKVRR